VYRTNHLFDRSELFFIAADGSGNVQYITAGSSDYIRISWVSAIFQAVALLLFVVAGLYGLIMLIRALVKKSYSKVQICLFTTMFLSLLSFAIFAVSVMIGILPIAVIVYGIIFILLAVAIITCIIMLWLSENRNKKMAAPSVLGLLIIVNIVYWQLWAFWI